MFRRSRMLMVAGCAVVALATGCGDSDGGSSEQATTERRQPTIESADALVALTPTSDADDDCSAPEVIPAPTEMAQIGVRRFALVDCNGTIEGFGVAQFNDAPSAEAGAEMLLAKLNTHVRKGPYDSDGLLGSEGRCADTYQDDGDDTPADDSQHCVLVRDRYVLFGQGEQNEPDSGEEAGNFAKLWFESAAR